MKRYGDVIAGEGRRLAEMVERVLEFAGFESGRATLDVRPADRGGIIEEALRGADPLVASTTPRSSGAARPSCRRCWSIRRGVALAAEPDRERAQVRRGAAGRWVDARRAEGARREVSVTISDNGGGIAARDLPHIFEPFYRGGDATARQIHGSGLGLSLVKRIVDERRADHRAHRGRQGQRVHAAPAAGAGRRVGRRPAERPAGAPAWAIRACRPEPPRTANSTTQLDCARLLPWRGSSSSKTNPGWCSR